jgi:ribonuclease-3
LDAVAEFIEPRFERAAEIAMEGELLFDPRSVLQMWAQSEIGTTPRYETVDSFGPDHARRFVVEVVLANGIRASGQGRSKQEAAQEAAKKALEIVGQPLNDL